MPTQIEDAIRKTTQILQARTPKAAVVLTLGHLAHLTDVPYPFLRGVVTRDKELDPYKVFALRREHRGHGDRKRHICVPTPLLLRAQRWIHHNILIHASAHPSSKAYGKDCSISGAAAPHCQASWLIKLDITNFFDSILEPAVYSAFLDLGYQPLVAFEMARICTRLRPTGNVRRLKKGQHFAIPTYGNERFGHLPQGAPTSPILANLAARDLDGAMSEIAQREGLRYTRYADDMTLSFHGREFSRQRAMSVIGGCYEAMLPFGLYPNRTKTRVIPPGARKLVLGLLVDGEQPRLTREFRDRMRMHLHFLERLGPAQHAQARGFDSVVGLQNHLFGLAAFAIGVDPVWGKKVRRRLRGIDWPTPFVMPA
ncbi:reverse transcriptase family protein [Pseudoxanthomonas putridarboris]|uniref:RNA-directed DNA polymerase n=1 Tax=Pseudoxanthomonas putridarboris TaxID=752605 RepID=A0ABU9IV92_9GAMM